jgi:CubicO group peptidase (beta-lactamase class C family)
MRIEGEGASALPRTLAELAAGIDGGLHLGGQLFVARRDGTLADLAFGEARPGEPMRRDHRMLWLSSSKPVTALLVARLWERERLDLDDPVARHLPEFAAGGKERVTLRHLLTHTGGFRLLDVGWPEKSWEEILARIAAARLEPRWIPGEKAGYHQTSSWFVLGEIARRLAGAERFADLAREEIFRPLGLDRCSIGMPVETYREVAPALAPMWNTAGGRRAEHLWTDEMRVVRPSPGGNGWGPIRELGRLYVALAAGGALDGVRLVTPQTVEALSARHRVGLFDHTFRAHLDWGLGFIPNSAWRGDPRAPYQYGPHASRRAFGHSGYRSSTAFADPEHGLAVALAVNGTPADDVHRERFTRLTAAIYEDLGLAPRAGSETLPPPGAM